MDYMKTKKCSSKYGETNDCAVKAVAIACDVAYSVAHKTLKLTGRRNRQGTYIWQTEKAIEMLGFKREKVDCSAKTVASIAKDSAFKKGYFHVHVRGHILAITGGVVQDWTEGRRHRIIQAYKVVPCESRKTRRSLINKIMAD